MIEDRVDHLLVAVDDLEDAGGKPGLGEQLAQADGDRRIALRRLQEEGVAARDRDRAHPQGDHRRKVERGDPHADAQRLAHRIDVNPRPRALGVFALEDMRDAAGELDHLEPALDVAPGVGDDLAVLARQQLRERLEVGLDQLLELEQDARPALGVGRGPGGLGGLRGGDRAVEIGLRAERDLRLDLAGVGVEHVALAGAAPSAAAGDEMVDLAHGGSSHGHCRRVWPRRTGEATPRRAAPTCISAGA